MRRPGMMIELDRCVGCLACVSACKERWDSGPGAARDWVRSYEHGKRGEDLGVTFYPGLCMQCSEHPCTAECPTGATYARPDGIVVVDPQVCIGCGNCVPMCPYGARHPDPEKKIVEKCNLCAPYVARGEQPACVQTCLAECRHFGDVAAPDSEVSRWIRERAAKPLKTAEIDVGPNVYYAPAADREVLIANGALKPTRSAELTRIWKGVTRPLAQFGVPGVGLLAVLGGAMMNLQARRASAQAAREADHGHGAEPTAIASKLPDELPRHRFGMRFLHWFNLVSWILLLVTGTALMSTPAFALFGTTGPAAIAKLFGGAPSLIRFHVAWGLLWAVVIVPFFLVFKKGGIEALREIRMTRDDVRWLMLKPWVAMGWSKRPLPPQDKYNAGQKAFAASALAGTATIIASGVVMSFHLGPAWFVAAMILVHKLAIAVALMGLAVHVTMAALVREERPALKSMVTGKVPKEHALSHATKWAEELAEKGSGRDDKPGSAEDE